MKNSISLAGITLLLAVSSLSAAMHFVSLESTNPTPPYTDWATAATNIQDAVNVAATNDVVVVTNGVYPGGVAVTNPLALQSVNGPQVTAIDGHGATRCAFLTDGASLTGFTLTNGYAGSWRSGGGGGICCPTSAFLTNCVIVGNSAMWGGGAGGGTLYNCILADNFAVTGATPVGGGGGLGGGAYGSTLYNCTLAGNSASYRGGGAASSALYNCAVARNSATYGGGVASCSLLNCTLTGNAAPAYYGGPSDGGGAYASTLYNCIAYFNTASFADANYDGSCTLNYCCTTPLPTNGVWNISVDPQLASASHLSADSPCRGAGNAAYGFGTDIDGEAWGNPPSMGCDEYHAGAVTGPLTVGVAANYTKVTVGYPVILTASIEGRTTDSVWDFGDGDVAINEPYIAHSWTQPGDYLVALWAFNESHEGGVSASLTIHVMAGLEYVATTSTNPQPPYLSWSTAARNIPDALNAWYPGASVLVSNGVYAGGLAITNPLAVLSVNGPQFTVIDGGGTNQCVSLSDGASLTGFTVTNGYSDVWGGGVSCTSTNVFLTNCMIVGNYDYGAGGGAYGGTLYNCTLTGNSACNCSGGADSSTLYNCTLTGNSAYGGNGYGGGAGGCTLYNCTLTGNSAYGDGDGNGDGNGYGGGAENSTLYNCTLTGNSSSFGGGAYGGAVYNCTLTGNSALNSGGGAASSTLYNCTLTGNLAGSGGGVGKYPPGFPNTCYNCIVYFNTASDGANYDSNSTLNYCCTAPLPTGGGNISVPPQFVDYAHGNLRLQPSSPCMNAGNNAYVTTATDLDGRTRIVGGRVDIGAYEFQPGAPGAFIAWLQQYGVPTDGSIDHADLDGTGFTVYQDWIAGLNPTNPLSVLRMVSVVPQGTNVAVTWQSVAGINYFLECSTNLSGSPCFWCVATNLPGQPNLTTFVHTNAGGPGPRFYRVGVAPP
ncbi:MAG TPA: choice-of-anchor Q domain-containing protein [Candidatus Acidoferrum sp.]|nr:choice-of-anchor Q domain-containing protein [Candidatus Acidoferrum sp.]